MKTLDELVRLTDRGRRINAKFVRTIGYKTGIDKQGIPTAVSRTFTRVEYTVTKRFIPARDQNRYTSSVKFLKKSPMYVKVSCSCPDFLYRWEFALEQVGAADIIYGNGEPPDDTNPKYNPSLCKHLVALRTKIKEKHGF